MTPLIQEILQNPALAGAAGLTGAGTLAYMLREVPKRVYLLVKEQLITTLTIDGRSSAYEWFEEWLAEHRYTRRARTLKLDTSVADHTKWTISPGYDRHFIWDDGRLVIVHRKKDGPKNTTGMPGQKNSDEQLQISTIGRSQVKLRAMVANAYAKTIDPKMQAVMHYGRYEWTAGSPARKRDLASVFIPAEQKRLLVARARWFVDGAAWYHERGVPWRFGVLLHGPPGTGKTSLVRALAAELDRPIYILSLSSINGDQALLNAFGEVPAGAVILLEDVDSFNVANRRAENSKDDAGTQLKDALMGVTLSGLLNAIDGVAAPEGVLLCMTTNHPDKLDAALVRSGRVDLMLEVGLMRPAQVAEMAERFEPGLGPQFLAMAEALPLRPASDWQGELMARASDGPKAGGNGLDAAFGKWPGTESDGQILDALRDSGT